MKAFRVANSPLYASVQDEGRFGHERFGVSNSGAGDIFSYKIGNLILNNDLNAPCIELIGGNLELEALNDICISITGGDLDPKIDGLPVKMWHTIFMRPFELLTFAVPANGFRSYVCLQGGVKTNYIMGSYSTHSKSGIGGKTLNNNEEIFVNKIDLKSINKKAINFPVLPSSEPTTINVTKGPEYDLFDDKNIDLFFNSNFNVTNRMDRIGIVLEGPGVSTIDGSHDIISDGTTKGVVQVPSDGNLYVLMNDCQTIGGYPRICSISSADFSTFSQLKPSSIVKFNLVSIKESQDRLKKQFNHFLNNNILDYSSESVLNLSFGDRQFNLIVQPSGDKFEVVIDGKPVKLEF